MVSTDINKCGEDLGACGLFFREVCATLGFTNSLRDFLPFLFFFFCAVTMTFALEYR